MASAEFAGCPTALRAVATGLVLMFALQCDDPPSSEESSSRARERAKQVRERVDDFSKETAETLRSHRPDGGVDVDRTDSED